MGRFEVQQRPHRQSESELLRNVYDRQDMVNDLKKKLENVLVNTHLEAEFAWRHGATENQMRDALHLIRHAQWHWDYAAASHGGAFHAPLEMVRTLGNGRIESSRDLLACESLCGCRIHLTFDSGVDLKGQK